jgi:hypothetical protein
MKEHSADEGAKEEATVSKNQTMAHVFTTENPTMGKGIPVEFTWQPNLQPIPRLETPSLSTQEETFEQNANRQEFKIYREDHKGFDGQRIEMFKLYNGMVLAISSAIFIGTLSVTKELKEIRGDEVIRWAWIFTILAVLMAFMELLLSQFAYEKSQENLRVQYQSHDYEKKTTNSYARACRYLLVGMCLILSIGVVLSITFLFMNRHTPRRGDEPSKAARPSEIVPVHTIRTAKCYFHPWSGFGSHAAFRSTYGDSGKFSACCSPGRSHRHRGPCGISCRAQGEEVRFVLFRTYEGRD